MKVFPLVRKEPGRRHGEEGKKERERENLGGETHPSHSCNHLDGMVFLFLSLIQIIRIMASDNSRTEMFKMIIATVISCSKIMKTMSLIHRLAFEEENSRKKLKAFYKIKF
jgi:hypothetical protein